jgi:hypothetical protein
MPLAAAACKEARKVADGLAIKAWNDRMLGYQGPAQPSPTIGDALNAGYGYLEVRCLGCDTYQTVVLDIIRRPKTTRSMSWSVVAGCLRHAVFGALLYLDDSLRASQRYPHLFVLGALRCSTCI